MNGFVDGHCDTMVKLWERREKLKENSLDLDIARLKKYESPVQIFALWLDPCYYHKSMQQTVAYLDFYFRQMEENKGEIAHVNTYGEILENRKNGKISSILALEGGEALEGEISTLRMYYRLGVRLLTLTWNFRNSLANGVTAETKEGGGLTMFGREVVAEMERLGMIVDVSHLSEKAFWDVHEITTKPYIASHSNAQGVCDAPRNLSDDQLRALGERGGIAGLNFYAPFLTKNGKANMADILRHIEHMLHVVGEDHIGLGSDFDGIDNKPEGLQGIQDIRALLEQIDHAFGREICEKVAEKNFMRVFRTIL